MAVDADDRLVDAGDVAHQVGDLGPELVGQGIARGVGEVQDPGPGLDHRLEDLADKIEVTARGVLGRELDVCGVLGRVLHRGHRQLQHLLPAHLELMLEMDVRGGQEGVDPGIFAALQGLPGDIDVPLLATGQGRHLDTPDIVGDIFDAAEIALRGHRKAGLDDVDIQFDKLLGQPELLLHIHAGPG